MASNFKDSSNEDATIKVKKNPAKAMESGDGATNLPIFTGQFLQHNKAREEEVQQLRRAARDKEEENALLVNHVGDIKLATEELEEEATRQKLNNQSLQEHLDSLRQLIVSEFSGEKVLGVDDDLTVDTADDLVEKLNSVMSGTPGRQQKQIIDIVGRMDYGKLVSQADGNFSGSNGMLDKSAGQVIPSSSRGKKKPHISLPQSPDIKKIKDLKKKSRNIEEVHGAPNDVQSTSASFLEIESHQIECPFCSRMYPRRAKVNQHIRSAHPGKDLIDWSLLDAHSDRKKSQNDTNDDSKDRQNNGKDDSTICTSESDDDAEDDSKNKSRDPMKRGREKVFKCRECNKSYSDKKRLDEHIEDKHTFESEDDDVICLDDITGSSNNNSSKEKTVRGRYEKERFQCPECSKTYAKRRYLNDHFENRHKTNSDDSFGDVAPNSHIAVRCNESKLGFQMYKVIKVFASGIRFKCVKYSPVGGNRWTESQEINKNVFKVDIVKILKTFRKVEESGVYTIDMEEFDTLASQNVNDGGGNLAMKKMIQCPECSKTYTERRSLNDHFENSHKTKSNSFGDVAPDAHIAVRCNESKLGFQVFKVIGVYASGIRFKCVKYSPMGGNRWAQTQEISKNIFKVDIVKILKTFRKVSLESDEEIVMEMKESGVYTIDKEELHTLASRNVSNDGGDLAMEDG